MCRGAANVQGKDWGAIITWATNDPPYLPSGNQMLEQLNTAYDAGAGYVIVFNYPQINPYGALTEEHFGAMQAFWSRMHSSPRNGVAKADVAVVLPKDYGWGMRQANDRIWGLWEADDLAPVIGVKVASLIEQYGYGLDIIYDDSTFNYTEKYSTIYYWNGTTIHSNPFSNIPASSLYASVAIVAFVLTCVPSYFVIKNKKRRTSSSAFLSSQETIQVPFSSKAVSNSLGQGQLEFVDDAIRFRTSKGRFSNRKEVIKEIPVSDVEGIKLFGDELSVSWRGGSDVFVVEEVALAERIREIVSLHLEEQRRNEQNLATMRLETTRAVSLVLEIVDSLFDVLRSLQKKSNWKQIESNSRRSEVAGKRLMNQTSFAINLEFSKLLGAVEIHLPVETSRETYGLLRIVHDYFLLASKSKLPGESHSDSKGIGKTILAYYTLNDIILSITVGEKDNQREISQLMALLESLPNAADLKVNFGELKGVIDKLGTEKEKEEFIGESRIVFKQILKQ